MSSPTVCRLCLNSSRNCKEIYDKNGRCNDMYDIAVKYFDPAILNVEEGQQISVMCLECWTQISDFHYFKQSVLMAQAKLLKDSKQAEVVLEPNMESSREKGKDIDSPNVTYYDIFVMDDEKNAQPRVLEVVKSMVECPPKVDNANAPIEILDDDVVIKQEVREVTEKVIAAEVFPSTVNTFTDGYFNDEQEEMELSSLSDLESIDGQFSSDEDEIALPNFFLKESKTAVVKMEEDNTSLLTATTSPVEPDDTSKSQDKQTAIKKRRKNGAQLDAIIAKWRPNLECSICKENFVNFTFLQQHYRHKHPGKICYFECCHYKFKKRNEIAEHARLHSNPNAYKCKHCGKLCNKRRSLNYHIRQKHKPGRVNSNAKSAVNTAKLDVLISQWKKCLECGVCGEPYINYMLLRKHFRHKHPDQQCHIVCCERKWDRPYLIEDHILMHLHPEPFVCKICSLTFTLERTLDIHMSTEHKIPIKKDISPENDMFHENDSDNNCAENDDDGLPGNWQNKIVSTRKSPYQLDASIAKWKPSLDCDLCSETYPTFTLLKEHFTEKHPGVVCYISCCHLKISRRFQVDQHARYHMDRDAFKCNVCGKSLRGSSNLKTHMDTVHDI